MKQCVHQKKYDDNKIQCNYMGTIRHKCNFKCCKHYFPALWYRLFGKRKEEK